MRISVFNADDHPILRKGVSNLLTETPDINWVGSAENGQDALTKIRAIQPDVAVLDIEMPYLSGLEVAKTLIAENSPTTFVLLTLFKDESFFRNAMAAGIKGYLLKESSEQEILTCIRSVHIGKAYVNANLTHFLLNLQQPTNSILDKLSDHEINILKLIARKKTSVEIADMLFISPKTVGNHRSNIGKKLNLTGEQNGLLKWAMEHRDMLA